MRGLYSKEYLIDELKKEAIKLGRVPKQEEFKHGERCRARFGSWKKALELAKLDTSHLPKKYTDEELLQQIKNKTQELGRIPKSYEVKQGVVIINRFESWINALRKAGYKKEELLEYGYKKSYTDEELLQQIRDKYKELKRIPKVIEIKSYGTIIKRFGNWRKALELAGFNKEIVKKKGVVRVKKYTDEELLQQIKDKVEELGRIPKAVEIKSYGTIIKRFESLSNALKLANFNENEIDEYCKVYKKVVKRKVRTKYTNEDLLKEIIDKYNKTGKIPTSSEVENYVNIIRRFGTWHNALCKAGFRKEDLKLYKEKYTDDELLNMIKEKSKELRRIPNINDMLYKSKIYEKFGTWENALIQAGFNKIDVYNRNKKYTNEDLLNILKERYYKQGKVPKTYEIKQYDAIVKRFGSFDKALKKANLI
ncbi:homing endonuclease associated repeat-containing protein [Clostridium sporogenes]|uniref:homing endonuclease associated repeat-containing protein n=1 Tax=Clostridium sporogenes TaxID=1509 RepID=UPI0013D1721D|nr:hypothetical protein [Clostridium sporogenes]NFH40788.1 hypothetical protein [Clostridium sporogenes]